MSGRPLRAATVALAVLPAACAVAPTVAVSPDLLAAAAKASPAARVGLMRVEGERIARTPFTEGNRVDLLIDGPASFTALAGAIGSARTRIDMESYEFDDIAGGRFADLLLAARARGVAVHLVSDAWGAKGSSEALFARLRAGGVQVLEFNPLRPSLRVPLDIDDRDHRKLLCVDGAVVVTGGVNISHVYETVRPPPTTDPEQEAWRDTDVRLTGPVAAQFEAYFHQTWRDQNGPPLPAPPPARPAVPGGIPVQALGGAPEDGQPLIYRTLIAAIGLAGRSVHLTTGFFVPTPDQMTALAAAARRGVDVQVIVPGRSTSDASVAAGRARYGDLLRAGVKIHEYQGRILHAKTAVIDGAWSAVGSSNLDWRSTIENNELDSIILSPGFGAQLEAVFRTDVAASRTVTLPDWRHRGVRERLRELRAALIAQFL